MYPGSRIKKALDPGSSFQKALDPGQRLKKVPNPVFRIHNIKNLSFLTRKIVTKLSEIWSVMFIPEPGYQILNSFFSISNTECGYLQRQTFRITSSKLLTKLKV